MVVGIGAVALVVVIGLLPGVAGGPSGTAAAGPDTPVPMGAFGGMFLITMGVAALFWRER